MMKKFGRKLLAVLAAGVLAICGIPVEGAFAGITSSRYGDLSYDYLTDGTIAITGCVDTVTSVEIPSAIDGTRVTCIYNSAFYDCKSLASVKIPSSVTSIGYDAFGNCTSLKTISLPEGVTSIAGFAFTRCTNLTTIVIPKSATNIVSFAFSSCSNLRNIYYTGTKAQWDSATASLSSFGSSELLNAHVYCNYKTGARSTGDLDGDGSVTTTDAYIALLGYSYQAAGGDSGLLDEQKTAADVNSDGTLTANDAYLILKYYSIHAAGQNISWSALV